ncbi:DUF5592 family protein [Enterococcus raffinosus]|uniref:DUF5592 family protein n=1 Tax=Enterococcus raffinosus TaxID=71452 RepID=UPI00288C73E0|nr:DUF5592 family protein [Enterococcus raffinosus]MDT2525136.1 DUF5592 family protein [Enterococcus raffinosus]MDT2592491.1 DUF5592 family protein [Enterococcus raffinosus]
MKPSNYGVVKNLTSQIRIKGPVLLTDVAVIFGFLFLGIMLREFIPNNHPEVRTGFVIYNLIFGIWLCLRPSSNPKKTNLQVLGILLKSRKNNKGRSI